MSLISNPIRLYFLFWFCFWYGSHIIKSPIKQAWVLSFHFHISKQKMRISKINKYHVTINLYCPTILDIFYILIHKVIVWIDLLLGVIIRKKAISYFFLSILLNNSVNWFLNIKIWMYMLLVQYPKRLNFLFWFWWFSQNFMV